MVSDFHRVSEVIRNTKGSKNQVDVRKLRDIYCIGEKTPTGMALLNEVDINSDEVKVQRNRGVPLEYVLGVAPFMGNLFKCTPDTLIPREWTELLVNTVMYFIEKEQLTDRKREIIVLEIGTGCGNIAVTLALNSHHTKIYASDVSEAAAEVARENVSHYNLEDRVNIYCGDMFEPYENADIKGKVDIVVCNPPYIPAGSLKKLDPEIIEHEPVIALEAGSYGIDIFRRLVNDSVYYLKPNGVLTFEFGSGQEKLVNRIISRKIGYRDIRFFQYDGEYRVASTRWQPD